jgi:hypothetical protein
MPEEKSKGAQVGEGFKALQKLAAESAEKTKNQPKKAAPPSVDTGSFGGLVKSLKDRASYAIFGPSKEDK